MLLKVSEDGEDDQDRNDAHLGELMQRPSNALNESETETRSNVANCPAQSSNNGDSFVNNTTMKNKLVLLQDQSIMGASIDVTNFYTDDRKQ